MTEPISVTALNQYVKGLLDRDRLLSQVLVRSEISNYKVYPSGHALPAPPESSPLPAAEAAAVRRVPAGHRRK